MQQDDIKPTHVLVKGATDSSQISQTSPVAPCGPVIPSQGTSRFPSSIGIWTSSRNKAELACLESSDDIIRCSVLHNGHQPMSTEQWKRLNQGQPIIYRQASKYHICARSGSAHFAEAPDRDRESRGAHRALAVLPSIARLSIHTQHKAPCIPRASPCAKWWAALGRESHS